jgi:aromatic ring-opening dioxygenase catalytic subunit (LigB family)
MERKPYFAPSLFVNHGGGPNPVLGEVNNLEIAESLREVDKVIDFEQTKAIILVTAHWEEDIISISSNDRHDLLFDYYNFPPESYHYKYEGKGDPELARKIHVQLSKSGLISTLDDKRGWDHGVFIPMMLIRPEADIPIVQLSILRNQNAKMHYDIGKVLYGFRKEGIAIIGSGLSYHNMARFRDTRTVNDGIIENKEFNDFLTEVCTGGEDVRKKIVLWEDHPGAHGSHPKSQADHLMPLIVAAGAGGPGKGRKVFDSVFKKKFLLSSFVWD